MTIGVWLGAVALALLPAAALGAVVQFAAPAGDLPAGRLITGVYDAILPSGTIITPAGDNVVSGAGAFGFALTPDGRFAIVSNDDERPFLVRSTVDPRVLDGSSIAVIDTATLRVIDRFALPSETYAAGVVAVADPKYPARTLVFAGGGPLSTVYVLDLDSTGHITPDVQHAIALPSTVSADDRTSGGRRPIALVAAGDAQRVYAVDEAGEQVTAIDVAGRNVVDSGVPASYAPSAAAIAGNRLLITNSLRDSSLRSVGFDQAGRLAFDPAGSQAVPMDGRHSAGRAHPAAIAVTPDAAYAFVALTSVDRIATVKLSAVPRVVGGTELRLFERGPYGTQPAGLALSHDGTRLYVALAGLNAVAVLDAHDPLHVRRLGLIPTGWSPCALAVARDDRTLFILNSKGFGRETSTTDSAGSRQPIWSTLQKVDLQTVVLNRATSSTLQNTRRMRPATTIYPPGLRNIVVILEKRRSFATMLADLGNGRTDVRGANPPAALTPNLHALARRYAIAANFYSDATTAGSVYTTLARNRIGFRDYGHFPPVAGDDDGATTDSLAGHVDLNYPGPNPQIRDEQRAREFIRDYAGFVHAHRQPHYTEIRLPGFGEQESADVPPIAEQVADGDRALGTIVAYLSRLPSWKSTVIFVSPDADRADPDRSYSLVIGPYARAHYLGLRHLSTRSVSKTSEEILHIPPFALGDLLATDMSDFFSSKPNLEPFAAIDVPTEREPGDGR